MFGSIKSFNRFLLVKDSRHQITNLFKRFQSTENSTTVSEKQIELRSKFEAAKIPDPESSASILIGHVIGESRWTRLVFGYTAYLNYVLSFQAVIMSKSSNPFTKTGASVRLE